MLRRFFLRRLFVLKENGEPSVGFTRAWIYLPLLIVLLLGSFVYEGLATSTDWSPGRFLVSNAQASLRPDVPYLLLKPGEVVVSTAFDRSGGYEYYLLTTRTERPDQPALVRFYRLDPQEEWHRVLIYQVIETVAPIDES